MLIAPSIACNSALVEENSWLVTLTRCIGCAGLLRSQLSKSNICDYRFPSHVFEAIIIGELLALHCPDTVTNHFTQIHSAMQMQLGE